MKDHHRNEKDHHRNKKGHRRKKKERNRNEEDHHRNKKDHRCNQKDHRQPLSISWRVTPMSQGPLGPRRVLHPIGGTWGAMTAADVAMPAADVPTTAIMTTTPEEADVGPPIVVPPTAPADVTDNLDDVTVNPTTPVRSYVMPMSEGPYVTTTGASLGPTLPELILSPSGQSQRLRELGLRKQMNAPARGDEQAGGPTLTATMSSGEHVLEPELGPEEKHFADEEFLPPPQERA
jgi:hypothetical protein